MQFVLRSGTAPHARVAAATRFPEVAASDLGTETDTNQNQQLCYHVLGTPQSADVVVLADPQHPVSTAGHLTHSPGTCGAHVPCSNKCHVLVRLQLVLSTLRPYKCPVQDVPEHKPAFHNGPAYSS